MQLNSKLRVNLFLSLLCLLFIVSCSDNKGRYKFTIVNEVEESKIDSNIRTNVDFFIQENIYDDLFVTYFNILESKKKIVADSSFYNDYHRDSILIGADRTLVQLSPIPIVYKNSNNIFNYILREKKSNSIVKSFILNFEIGQDNNDVQKFWLYVVFENSEGILIDKKLSLKDSLNYEFIWVNR